MRKSRLFIGLILFAGLFSWTPSFGQENAGADQAQLERQWLESQLKVEAVQRLTEIIEFQAKDPLVRGLAETARRRITPEFIAELGNTRSAEKILERLFEAELRSGAVKAEALQLDPRQSMLFRNAYQFKAIDGKAKPLANGYSPSQRSGYLPEVAAIDVHDRHSMTDIRDYLGNRMTHTALETIVKNGRAVEIHTGNINETISSLESRGFNVLGEITSANGNYERLFMARGPGGEVVYAVTGINGVDRVRHLSSLMRFAGDGVKANNISIVGDLNSLKQRNFETFQSSLEHLGRPGGLAWLGFRAGVNNELESRAKAQSSAEFLEAQLGSDRRAGLAEQIAREAEQLSGAEKERARKLAAEIAASEALKGLNGRAQDVFSTSKSHEALRAAEAELVRIAAENPGIKALEGLLADGKLRLKGGVSAESVTTSRTLEHRQFRAEELLVNTKNGRQSLKLVSNYYGDVMGDMTRALIASGHKNIAYFGTAGGLAEGVRVGDVHVPSEVYDHAGRKSSGDLVNGLNEHLRQTGQTMDGRLKTDIKLANVFSPLQETNNWLEQTRQKAIGSVEVELSHITEAIEKHNRGAAEGQRVRYQSAVMISDVPGSNQTLGNHNGSTAGVFESMVDRYLASLGIESVELLEVSGERVPTNTDKLIDQLIESTHGRGKSGFLHRENLRFLIEQSLSAESIERAIQQRTPLAELELSNTQREVVETELTRRYRDVDVSRAIEATNATLTRAVKAIQQQFPNQQFELKIGSIERGFFSPNQGVTVEFSGAEEIRAAFEKQLKKAAGETRAPPVTLGKTGVDAISVGRGESLLSEYNKLERIIAERMLSQRQINFHTPVESNGNLRVERLAPIETLVNKTASPTPIDNTWRETLRRQITRYKGEILSVDPLDPRLNGRNTNVLLVDGKSQILVANNQSLTQSQLLNLSLETMRNHLLVQNHGAARAAEILSQARSGQPVAVQDVQKAELKSAESLLASREPGPLRELIQQRASELKVQIDPYTQFRTNRGLINWSKVQNSARQHGMGVASFTLGIFLKELAVAIESGDKATIERFFDGLAGTDFWLNYGLFAVGAEAGSAAYARTLQRVVRPAFVGSLLKANVAMASGMALSEIAMGHFDGKTYAINLSGLMLSTTAVKTGLAGIRWVKPLSRLKNAQRLKSVLRLGSAPGWIYAGVETAVVLYFGDKISKQLSSLFERHNQKRNTRLAIQSLLDAAESGADSLTAHLDDVQREFSSLRNLELASALAVQDAYRADLEKLGRELHVEFNAYEQNVKTAERTGKFDDHFFLMLKARHEERIREIEDKINARSVLFQQDFNREIDSVYEDHQRRRAFDPEKPSFSRNRSESFDDELAVLRHALQVTKSEQARQQIRARIALMTDVKARDLTLIKDTAGATKKLGDAINPR